MLLRFRTLIPVLFILFAMSAAAEWITVNPGIPQTGDVSVLEDQGDVIRLAFSFAGFQQEIVPVDGVDYVRISAPNMAPSLDRGEPELPIWAKSVIIPDRGSVSLSIVSADWEEMASLPVLPSKGNLPRTIDPASVPYEFGTSYAANAWAPAASSMLSAPFVLRDFRGITVLVRPVQYNGARETMRVCREMVVEVRVGEGPGIHEKTRPRSALSREFLPLYESMFLNLTRDAHPIAEQAGRLLIISADQFFNDMADFVTWKMAKGIDTKHVRYSEIGGTGNVAIKNYIQNEYDGPGVTYVLLVGDKEHLPTYSHAGGEADPIYTLLEDGDVYPDAFISRFSVQSSADVLTMVERSIDYEKDPTPATAWYHKATGIASSQGSPPDYQWLNGFRDKLLAWHYTEMDQIYDPSASSSQVTTALNNGRSLVLYMGHGSTTSWGTTGFSNSNINALVNDSMLPIISSVACVNGDFSSTTCFGEAWLRATNGGNPTGAIAFYGSSINQSWVPPQYGQQGFIDSLVSERYSTVGGTLFMGSVAMMEHYGGGSSGVEIFNTWHIFGDCSVQLRNAPPAAMTANYPNSIPVGSQVIQVSVPGVPGALVAFSDNGELLGSGYTDAAGDVSVTLDDPLDTPGTIDITITAYNKIPVIDDIPVIAPDGPYVLYAGMQILGDGVADIGDTVSVDLELENVGSETAHSVTGSLVCAHADVTVTAGVQNYGDIDANTSALPDSPFRFAVGSLADETSIPFDVEIVSGDSLWTGTFSVIAHAPELEHAGWTVDDASGNGNGRPDPGETVELRIIVENNGSGTAREARLEIADTDPYITVSGTMQQDLGDVSPGGQVMSPAFIVTFDTNCPEPYAAQIPMEITSNHGVYSAVSVLSIMVGQGALLFVDADAEPTEMHIVDALDAMGISYLRWNSYEPGVGTVPVGTLLSYQTVLWAAGDQGSNSLTPQNRTNLSAFLSQGGSLLLTAENYLSIYGTDPFTTDYLHVDGYQTNISGSTLSGTPGDPIGDGVNLTLGYPAGLDLSPDKVMPDAEAVEVFRMQDGNNPVAIRYPATGTAAYRVVFFGAALEAFPATGSSPNTIHVVLNRTLAWLGGFGDFSPPTIPDSVHLSTDGTLTWNPSSDNVGVDHYAIYRGTMPYFDTSGMTVFRTETGTSAQFAGSIGNPLINYYFRVTARDAMGNESDPSASVGGFDWAIEQ